MSSSTLLTVLSSGLHLVHCGARERAHQRVRRQRFFWGSCRVDDWWESDSSATTLHFITSQRPSMHCSAYALWSWIWQLYLWLPWSRCFLCNSESENLFAQRKSTKKLSLNCGHTVDPPFNYICRQQQVCCLTFGQLIATRILVVKSLEVYVLTKEI